MICKTCKYHTIEDCNLSCGSMDKHVRDQCGPHLCGTPSHALLILLNRGVGGGRCSRAVTSDHVALRKRTVDTSF